MRGNVRDIQAWLVRSAIRSALIAGAMGAVVSTAQAADAASTRDEELEQVVVTGSRIASTGFTTPTPVTVLGSEAIEELGITNIGAGANQLPAFRATTTPTTNGWGSFNVGAQIVNLRGLGVNRNLVLIDGRRVAPMTRESTVDLNIVPSGLVERLDVVTGGASAAYGSDAIAGAVNVILNKNLDGIKAQIDYGVTGEGDGDNYHAALAGGSAFAGGRGRFILGGEFAKQDGIGDCITRGSCVPSVIATSPRGGAAGSVPGLPNFNRINGTGGFLANPNGAILSLSNGPGTAAIRNLFGTGNITFDNAGNPIPYVLGLPASGTTGAGAQTVPSFTTAELEVPVERYATFGHAYFDLTDNLRWFIEGSYAHVEGSTLQTYYFGAPLNIFYENPFVPAQIRALLPPASATPNPTRPIATADVTAATAFNLSVLGQRRGASSSEADMMRVTTGLNWKFSDRWSSDAYYQYAKTDRLQQVDNNLVVGAQRVINRPGSGGLNNPGAFAYWSWATDAVYHPDDAALPAAQRRVVCRATISNDAALRAAAAGCVPFNPFGAQASQAALDYVYGTLVEDVEISQHVVAANVQGRLADLWAGPLSIAAGAEFRRDSTAVLHDDLSNLFAYFQNFGADYEGEQDVLEGYVEAELPLASGIRGIDALSLNAAIRQTRYDISGYGGYNQAQADNSYDATTWKIGLQWQPVDWARLRFTMSEDIRAANFSELFLASASSFTAVQNRLRGGASENPTLLNGGNPALGPETGNTWTVGLVMQPPFIDGLSMSLDYYDIRVNEYVGSPGGAQNVVDRCQLLNIQQFCNLITYGPGQTLVEVANANVNLQWLKNRGIDWEVAYRLPLSKFSSLPGTMNFRLLANRTLESSTNLFGVVTDRAGETGGGGGAPDWVATLISGYSSDRWHASLTTRFISAGIFNVLYTGPDSPNYNPALPNTVNDNTVGSVVYFNLNGGVKFGAEKNIEVFGQVNNLMDRSPPIAPQLQYPTNPVYFDQLGRSYRVGVRMNF